MAIARLGTVSIKPAGGSGGTSSNVSTIGATLIILGVTASTLALTTVSDNQGNTYTPLTKYSGAFEYSNLYYCLNPIVNASHNFTIGGPTIQSMAIISWYSGNALSSVFDTETGQTNVSGTALQTGSITPANNGSLIIATQAFTASARTSTVNSGMSMLDQSPAGVYWGMAMADLVQTTAAAINPTFTISGGSMNNCTMAIAAFKENAVAALALSGKGVAGGRGKLGAFAGPVILKGKGSAQGRGKGRLVSAMPLAARGEAKGRGKVGPQTVVNLVGKGLAAAFGKGKQVYFLQIKGKGRAGGSGKLGLVRLLFPLKASGKAMGRGKTKFRAVGERVITFTSYWSRRNP